MSSGQKIPIDAAIEIVTPVATALYCTFGVDEVIVAGSIRRRRPEVGDADLTIIVNDTCSPPILWPVLDEFPHKMVRGGDCERSIRVSGLKIELRMFPANQRGSALLFSTGSGGFNVGMRIAAKRQGLLLNRYGLWTRDGDLPDKLVASESEEEIFAALGMGYVPPEERDRWSWK